MCASEVLNIGASTVQKQRPHDAPLCAQSLPTPLGAEVAHQETIATPLQEILGADTRLMRCSTGASVAPANLPTSGVVGIFFCAHWCPPCKRFMPSLLEAYDSVRAAGKEFEVVMLPADRNETEFREHCSTLPWVTTSFKDRRLMMQLMGRLGVGGFPSLVLLDASTGHVLSTEGRKAVTADPSAAAFPWHAPSSPP
eukprot:CAMPEP_0181296072 /NCGR_PEP_ID=MMETSP1101-20121128/4496_1 /TAXON_ID=46948 /ORGANISM="Rhodomonas abbreviata, Strain Caron Lab Isolate" /LENGTH=196 /DNA_ID=CAMNT_0023400887 /DNA_START=478 /DNA_END=1065 /DNA_ORIENTATION=+